MMLCAEMPGRDAREGHLVVALGVEAYRVGSHAAGKLLDEPGHRGTVRAAAEEARRLARAQLPLHRSAQRFAELLAQGVEVRVRVGVELRPPVRCHRHMAARGHHAVPGRHAVHAAEDGARRRDRVEEQVVEDRLHVDLAGAQRIGLRRIAQSPFVQAPAQRLRREAVHRQHRAAVGQRGSQREVTLRGRGRLGRTHGGGGGGPVGVAGGQSR